MSAKRYLGWAALLALIGVGVALLAWTKFKKSESASSAVARSVSAQGSAKTNEAPVAAIDRPQTNGAHFEERARQVQSMRFGQERGEAFRALIAEWMKVAPTDCLAFLAALGKDPMRWALSNFAVECWLKTDAAAAVAWVEHRILENEENSEFYLEPTLLHLYRKGGLDSLHMFLRQFPQTNNVYAPLTRVYAEVLKQDGVTEEAAQLVEKIDYEPSRNTLFGMLGSAMAREFGSALLAGKKIAEIESEMPAGAVTGLVGGLLRTDRERTLAWLAAQPATASLDVARYRESLVNITKDPRHALETALSITREDLQAKVVEQALSVWAAQDYFAAEKWAVASGLPETLVGTTLAAARKPSPNVFAQEMRVASAIQNTRERTRNQWVIFGRWKRNYPDEAERWLVASDLTAKDKEMFRLSSSSSGK